MRVNSDKVAMELEITALQNLSATAHAAGGEFGYEFGSVSRLQIRYVGHLLRRIRCTRVVPLIRLSLGRRDL